MARRVSDPTTVKPAIALTSSIGAHRGRRSELGQAAVESALVLPLFVFIILGTLQLSLMHQARLLTKYAAYKAVRVGALTSVNMGRMERAALAVLLPTIKKSAAVHKTTSGSEFSTAFPLVASNQMPEGAMKFVEIKVCGPTKDLLSGEDDVDFDAEGMTGSADGRGGSMSEQGWKDFDRGRLVIQVTYNYRMVIPFADMMLYNIFVNQERTDLMWTFRLGKQDPQVAQHAQLAAKYNALASQGMYVFPIRANYLMRMQSSLFPNTNGHELPQSNQCVIRFKKKGSGSSGSTGVGGDTVDDETEPEPE